jgi:hypothetical protein
MVSLERTKPPVSASGRARSHGVRPGRRADRQHSVSILGGLVPAPLFALVPVYFWCLVRPDLMTPAVAFSIGFAEDVLSGGPPASGPWPLCLPMPLWRASATALPGFPAWRRCWVLPRRQPLPAAVAYFTVAGLNLLSGLHLPPWCRSSVN